VPRIGNSFSDKYLRVRPARPVEEVVSRANEGAFKEG
jgi:hypothetical protein